MKKWIAVFLPVLTVFMYVVLNAQQAPPAGGGRGRGAAAAPPAATGPIADATNKIIDAINKQDAAYFDKALSADSIILDEDGHVGIAAKAWVAKLTSGMAKKIAITNLRIGELGADGAWAGFAYTLDETANGAPNQIKGLSNIVYKKTAGEWQAVLIHIAVNGKAVQPH